VQFSRLVAEATSPAEALPRLLAAAIEETGAEGAFVVEVGPDAEAHVVAHEKVTDALCVWAGDIDDLAVDAQRLGLHALVRPLISGGGLFGALVLLFREEPVIRADKLAVVEGLVDLTATILGKSAATAELQRVHGELRATQLALAQAEKLRALGEMAAGVAHDLKNVLNPLSMHVQVLERALTNDKRALATEQIAEIKDVLKRGVRTIERLRDYGRSSLEAQPVLFDVRAAVEEAVVIAKPRLSSSTHAPPRVVVSVEGEPRVLGHREEVVSAIVNLVINAIDALRDRAGTISINAKEADGRGGVVIEVADDGPGMPPEVERRVFEPFFTTKGAAGTGLGLAMVYACMRRHAGSVDLVTSDKGTRFTLRFPRPVEDPASG